MEKFPLKQFFLRFKDVKDYAVPNGFMTEEGNITELGKKFLEYRPRKDDGYPYLAATEAFAKKVRKFLKNR